MIARRPLPPLPVVPSESPKFTGCARPVADGDRAAVAAGAQLHAVGQVAGVEGDVYSPAPGRSTDQRPRSSVSTWPTSSPSASVTVICTSSIGPLRLVEQRAEDLLALGVGDARQQDGEGHGQSGDEQGQDERTPSAREPCLQRGPCLRVPRGVRGPGRAPVPADAFWRVRHSTSLAMDEGER